MDNYSRNLLEHTNLTFSLKIYRDEIHLVKNYFK